MRKPKIEKNSEVLFLRVTPERAKAIKRLALKEGVTVNKIVNHLLDQFKWETK